MFEYEAWGEPILYPKSNYKINFYNYILDQTIASIEERFELNNNFGFFV